MPVSERPVLGLAAATGDLQLYALKDSQVRNVASEEFVVRASKRKLLT